jgi:hypothetical protein
MLFGARHRVLVVFGVILVPGTMFLGIMFFGCQAPRFWVPGTTFLDAIRLFVVLSL